MTSLFKKILSWIIAFVCAALIVMIVSRYEKEVLSAYYTSIEFTLKRRLCDGSFVASVVLLAIGGLIGIAEHGGLDALKYALWRLKERVVHPRIEEREDNESYYDFVKAREEREKAPFVFLLVIGFVFLTFAVILAL